MLKPRSSLEEILQHRARQSVEHDAGQAEDSAQRAAQGGQQDGVGQAQARSETRQEGDQRQEAGNAEYDAARPLHAARHLRAACRTAIHATRRSGEFFRSP